MAFTRVVLTVWALVAATGCIFDSGGSSADRDGGAGADAALSDAGEADAGPRVSDEVLDGLAAAALADPGAAKAWAKIGSAPQVFFTAYLPIYQADQAFDGGETCPAIVVNGNLRSYTGNCTDSKGVEWFGTATVIGPVVDDLPGTVSYADFGHDGTVMCGSVELATEQRYTGTVTRGSALPALPVDVDLKLAVQRADAACALETTSFGYDYQLTVETSGDTNGNDNPDSRTFDGRGRIGKASGELAGLVMATTANEVTDEACASEAFSGTSTFVAGAHTLVVTYDGATDCSSMSTVQASLDGAPPQTLTGILCSVRPGGRGAAPGALLLTFAAVFLTCRRRRDRARDGRG